MRGTAGLLHRRLRYRSVATGHFDEEGKPMGWLREHVLRTTLLMGALLAALAVGACNTAEGFGEDVEKGGEAIQRGAR